VCLILHSIFNVLLNVLLNYRISDIFFFMFRTRKIGKSNCNTIILLLYRWKQSLTRQNIDCRSRGIVLPRAVRLLNFIHTLWIDFVVGKADDYYLQLCYDKIFVEILSVSKIFRDGTTEKITVQENRRYPNFSALQKTWDILYTYMSM